MCPSTAEPASHADDDGRTRRRRAMADKVLIVLSIVMLLAAAVALDRLERIAELDTLMITIIGGMPAPKLNSPATNFARLGMVAAAASALAAIASLWYRSAQSLWAWNVALIMWFVAIAASIAITVWGAFSLITEPARGDFAGLPNLAMLIIGVIIPAIVSLATAAAVYCRVGRLRDDGVAKRVDCGHLIAAVVADCADWHAYAGHPRSSDVGDGVDHCAGAFD